MRKILLIMGLLVAMNGKAGNKTDIRFPSVLADNMVLQQQTEVRLWGTAKAGSTITVTPSWSKRKATAKADSEGQWTVSVQTPAAGGPYDIQFNDTLLRNILIGEVWLCAGQSNMEMPVGGFDRQPCQGGNSVIAKAKPSVPIRMFITDSDNGKWLRQAAKTPQADMTGWWLENTPEAVSNTSAAAYYFARNLQELLDVPVGIIVSTLGGSRIEPWLSREAVSTFSFVDTKVLDGDGKINNWETPCVLFNAKIAPLTPFAVRGFLWYQGESNRHNVAQYRELMPAMVKDWRAKWGRGDLPFYYVEIAPYRYEGDNGTSAAYMREVQQQCMRLIPNSGMVSTLDIGNENFIHPVNKAAVGERLAWWALGHTYGEKGFLYASPLYKSMEVKDHKIYINVENADRGLCPMWTSLKGFEIAGADKKFYPAFAEIEEKTCRLAVSSDSVPDPVAVRYCFHNYAEPSVYNLGGLPLAPFRTDRW